MTDTEQGFTLVEVLVAVAILGVAIMSVFTIYMQCAVEIRRAKNRTIAANCAQQMMEMICSTPYALCNYHGLTTASNPPADNPVREDILKWKSALSVFPAEAVGTISVTDDAEISYSSMVTVELTYDNYGRKTASTLSLKLPQNSP